MKEVPRLVLESLTLSGFKCFQDTGALKLRPLTLVFGRNNSGKSTLLQALLLLKQSLESPELGPRLNTRGDLYPGGSFVDLVHQHDPKLAAEFAFEMQTTNPASTIRFVFRRDAETGAPRLQELKVAPHGVDALVVKRGLGRGGPYELRIGKRSLGVAQPANFVLGEGRFLPLIGEEPPKVGKPNQRNREARERARDVLRLFEQSILDSRCIGAFRRAPHRRYEYEGREPVGPDPTGERAAQVLIADAFGRRRSSGALVDQTNKWLLKLAGVRLEIASIAENVRLFELRVRRVSRRRGSGFDNLADEFAAALRRNELLRNDRRDHVRDAVARPI